MNRDASAPSVINNAIIIINSSSSIVFFFYPREPQEHFHDEYPQTGQCVFFFPPSRVFWQSRVSTRCVVLSVCVCFVTLFLEYKQKLIFRPRGSSSSSSCIIIIDNVTTTTQLITPTELGRSAKAKV